MILCLIVFKFATAKSNIFLRSESHAQYTQQANAYTPL